MHRSCSAARTRRLANANGNGNGHPEGYTQVSPLALQAPEEYEKTRLALVKRYEELRERFNEEARK